MDEVPMADQVKVLRLEPGDQLVLMFKQALTDRAREAVREQWNKHFPLYPVAVVEGDAEFVVLRNAPKSTTTEDFMK